jgi:hypothetical protein
VARIDAAATISGRNASSEANTKASTASAPTAPRMTSARTPYPSDSEPMLSASRPVTPTVLPAGFAPSSAARISSVGGYTVGDEARG